MTTLAIDIGGTKLAAALISSELQVTARREIPTPASKTPDALDAALADLVSPFVEQAQRVAIASTGIIREGTLLAINPQNLGGLLHYPLVEQLEKLTGLPTLAVNDAQAAAWAEYRASVAQIEDMVFITVSTGVGAGWSVGGNCSPEQAGWPGIWGIRLPIRMAQLVAVAASDAWRLSPRAEALRPMRPERYQGWTPKRFSPVHRTEIFRRRGWLLNRQGFWPV